VKYDGLFHISDWFPTIVSLAQLDPRLLKKELQFQDDKNPYLDGIDHSGEESNVVCLNMR